MAPRKHQPPTRRVAALLSHMRPAAADVETHTEAETEREPDDGMYDAHVADLAVQEQLPVLVLDMLLPRQRVSLAVSDAAHTRMVCGCLESAAASGTAPCFGVVGIDPLSNQVENLFLSSLPSPRVCIHFCDSSLCRSATVVRGGV